MKEELAKQYNPADYEDGIYQQWEKSGFFNPDNLNLDEKAESYTIVLPPPNVTGTLHLGHAAMLAIEDILIRTNRMQGKRTLWVPGTDHAAIATQTKVEKIIKEEGATRHSLGREKFLERVNEFAQNSHDTIVNQTKKMGASIDWSREAYTLDKTRNKAVKSVFKLMYDDGLIYRGERIVNWCPRCKSTLADDEVEYKAQKAKFYTFKYSADFPISISTTRPETKLGDTAVAVNPKAERYKQYIGQVFEVDFVGVKLKIQVIADYNVDMNFGTGALGVTPAHSAIDWQMAENNDLEKVKVIDEDGNILGGFGEYSGLSAKAAREKIVEKLRQADLIEKEEEIDNNLSLCYRCDTPVEPLPSLQWFIDVNKKILKYNKSIKELSVEAVEKGVFGRDKIKIIPERFEKQYFNWMNNLRDWCISRQIWFGHQIPVVYDMKDPKNSLGQIVFKEGKIFEQGEELITASFKNANILVEEKKYSWQEIKDAAMAYSTNCCKTSRVIINNDISESEIQDEDTLDTWFSSGLWTFSTLAKNPEQIKIEDGKLIIDSEDFKKFHPTQVLETAYDILFFWVARMIIMTTYVISDIPFQNVYLHGLVLDDKGKKMSKSKGNVIDPLDMIAKYGTDAVRLSLVIGCTPGNDTKLSEEKIEAQRNFINKLWNVSRFILTSVDEKYYSTPADKLPEAQTLSDKWILDELLSITRITSTHLNQFNFSQSGEILIDFICNSFSDWYLEASKFENSSQRDEILIFVLKNILKLEHPFIPFVTEVIWNKFNDSLLMVEPWPKYKEFNEQWVEYSKEGVVENFKVIQDTITAIRNARAENKVEPARKVEAIIYAGKNLDLIKANEVLIKSLKTGISNLEIKAGGEKIDKAIYVSVGEIEIYLIGAVDEVKEKERIAKEIINLEKFISGLKARLNNEEFVGKAPEKVVAIEKEKLAKAEAELENLKKN